MNDIVLEEDLILPDGTRTPRKKLIVSSYSYKKAAAKWLNKYATAIAGLELGTYMYNQNNNDKDVQLSR